MPLEQGSQLVGGGDLGAHVVIAHADDGLQLGSRGAERFEPAEPVPFGAQVVGQLVAVAGVALGLGGTPAGPGGVEGVGVDRHHRMPRREQPGDDQAVSRLDRHRQLARVAMVREAPQCRGDAGFVMGWRPAVQDLAGVVEDSDVVGLRWPSPIRCA